MIRAFLSAAVLAITLPAFSAGFVGQWASDCRPMQDSADTMISAFEAKADMTGTVTTHYFENNNCSGNPEIISMPMTFSYDQHTLTVTTSPAAEVTVVMTFSYVLVGDMLTLAPKQTWVNGQEQTVVDQTPMIFNRKN